MILKEAIYSDWKLLLDWRNDIESRKNSHSMDLISEESHKKWFKKLLKNSKRKLFIAYVSELAVGTVRADFDIAVDAYELSWTVAPDARGKGIGKRMVNLFVKSMNSSIRAEIKEGNTSSIKIAEYAGLNFINKEGKVLHYSNKK